MIRQRWGGYGGAARTMGVCASRQAGRVARYLNALAVHAVSERQFTVQRGNG